MTLNEATYELKMIIRRNNLSDDDRLDNRLVRDWIHGQRELWIRNEVNKNRMVDQSIIQSLGCVNLEVADRSSCPSFTTGYSVLQTSQDIPKRIELNNWDGIFEVGPIDKIARRFSYINISRARFAGNGQFNSKIIYAFPYGNRIMLIAKDMESGSFLKYLRYIGVRGLFADPTEVASFTHVDGTACYSNDDDYPMNRWMWQYMRQAILEANFDLLIRTPTDKVNNANDTLKGDVNES